MKKGNYEDNWKQRKQGKKRKDLNRSYTIGNSITITKEVIVMPNEIEMIEQSKTKFDAKEVSWFKIIGFLALIAAVFMIF